MGKLKNFIEKKHNYFVYLFFAIFLLIGLLVFRDYGISWDEGSSRKVGLLVFDYIFNRSEALINNDILKYYGTVFELPLAVIERVFDITDLRTIYFIRHLATFLFFFVGVIFFYKLCLFTFKSWKFGLLGSLFLILSPRIFAHSFYNSKDLVFMSMLIISMYTFIIYNHKKKYIFSILHALVSALLIDIRIMGIIIPLLTVILFIVDIIFSRNNKIEFKNTIINFLIYIVLLFPFIILFWPILWTNPIHNFINAFKTMSQHTLYSHTILYMGEYIKAAMAPWHYIPVWIAISTPLLYVVSFLLGCFYLIKSLIINTSATIKKEKYFIIYFLGLIIPIAVVLVLNSILFDAWRHMFFVYPMMLIISINGIKYFYNNIKNKLGGKIYIIISAGIAIIILVSMVNTTYFMIKNHPYQNVYFNVLAGKDMTVIKDRFEMDYWGLSYRKALEYIVEKDKSEKIKIFVANQPGIDNANILFSEDRDRIVYVNSPEEAEYFISNYRWHREEYNYKNEVFFISIGGAKIIVVYKL